MQKLSIPNYTVEELEALLYSNPDYIVGFRLMALIQIKKGLPSRKLEGLYYKSHSRYCAWVKSFNECGIDGLKNKPKSGRNSLLTDEYRKELYNVLLNNRPEDYGFNSATWNGPIVRQFISQHFGVEYKKAQIYNILKSLGFTYQKAKGKYPEADPIEQAQFVDHLKKTSTGTK